MMLVPRRNNFDLFDELFDDGFFSKKEVDMMKTDVKEGKNEYKVSIDLPGFKKENIDLSLHNGYLVISAKTEKVQEDSDDEKYVRKERFFGHCSRRFYVGKDISEEDIKAQFEDGVLKIEIPKYDETKKIESAKKIEIK